MSHSSAKATALPRPPSLFVGRGAELEAVTQIVRGGSRLVTLTGPGGSGKTRLAIEVAPRVAADFANGVHWIPLASLRVPRLLLPTLARSLGVDNLARDVGDRRMLLLLDNFEQVVDGAPQLVPVLEACPGLVLLVTSRERLRVAGEVEYAVPPLVAADGVELFCTRAQAAPDATIGELCARLDHLPLALELAAARTSVLSPAQILARLGGRLDLFRGGRDAEPRQRTLRAAIEWSCQLLDDTDLRLFTRLGVFDGGCTLEAAEEVAAADLDGLQSLVDKNLLRQSGGRFWMLETIHEYAAELLDRSDEADDVRAVHLAWCVAFVDHAQRVVIQGQPDMAQRIKQEFGNIRAAVRWSIATEQFEQALLLVRPRTLWQSLQTHLAEGGEWLESILSRGDAVGAPLRARALATAGDIRRVVGDLHGARTGLTEAMGLAEKVGDPALLASIAYPLGRVLLAVGDYERGADVTGAALDAARAAGDDEMVAASMSQLGEICYLRGDRTEARRLLDAALLQAKEVGDTHAEADALRALALLRRDEGELAQAAEMLERSAALQHHLGDGFCESLSIGVLGEVLLRDGRPDRARAAFAEALDLQRRLGQWSRAIDLLWGLAATAATTGDVDHAARLLAAEERVRADAGAPFQISSSERRAAVRRMVEQRVDAATLARARDEARLMSRDEVMALALTAGKETNATATATSAQPMLRNDGEFWSVTYGDRSFVVKDSKGMHHLAALVREPGREMHALDLAAVEYGDDPTRVALRAEGGVPVLDEQAKASYRHRLQELQDDLAEATEWNDTERVAKLEEEVEFLTRELTGALGLGGRDRVTGTAAERARVNITRAIRSAVDRIREQCPELADHLDATVRTGAFCVYISAHTVREST